MKYKIGDKVWTWIKNNKPERGIITATIEFVSNSETNSTYLIDDEYSSGWTFQNDLGISEEFIFKTKKECKKAFGDFRLSALIL